MARVEIVYPYALCKDCPLAQADISEAVNSRPYSDGPQTELKKIALACIVNKRPKLAAVGGLRLDSYKLRKDGVAKKSGETECLVDEILTIEGYPPEFCPQTKRKK